MFIKNEDGFVLAFTAILLPVFMLIGVLIIDGGNLYIRHEQVRHLSKEGANSGILVLEGLLDAKAQNNYNSICVGTPLPVVCSSTNIFDFLSSTEVQNIILNVGNQNQVKLSVINFIKDFDPENSLTVSDITVVFPHEYSGGNVVKILVKIKTNAKGFFETILPNSREIKVESKSYLTLS